MIVRELTLAMLLDLIPRLDARHRVEILRAHESLEKWAVDRCTQPGIAWAFFLNGEIVGAGGVITERGIGHLWMAGAAGWTDYARHPIKVAREIFAARAYQALQCTCYEDNEPAQRFAEYLGMQRQRVDNGLVYYGRSA